MTSRSVGGAYRIVWTVAVGALVVRGLALGLDRDPTLTATVALLGAAFGVAWSLGGPGRRVGRTAVVTGSAAAAVVGHLPALGAGLLLIALMVAATAPTTLRARSDNERRNSARAVGDADATDPRGYRDRHAAGRRRLRRRRRGTSGPAAAGQRKAGGPPSSARRVASSSVKKFGSRFAVS